MSNINGIGCAVSNSPFEMNISSELQELYNKTIEHINNGSFTGEEIENVKNEIRHQRYCVETDYYKEMQHSTNKHEEYIRSLNSALENKLMNDYMSGEKGLIGKCYKIESNSENGILYDKILSFKITDDDHSGNKMIEYRFVRVMEVGLCERAAISIGQYTENLYNFAKNFLLGRVDDNEFDECYNSTLFRINAQNIHMQK